MIKNLLSLDWWRDSLNRLTFADIEQRLATIGEAVRNPRSHPLTFLLLLAIAVVLVLVIVLFVVMLWVTKLKKERVNYDLVNEEGTVVKELNEEQARRVAAAPFRKVLGRGYKRFLVLVAVFVLLWVALGASTQTRVFCGGCHKPGMHIDAPVANRHNKRSCTSCHEGGNLVQRATINLVPRLLHVATGIVTPKAPSGYAAVSSDSCKRCHEKTVTEARTTTYDQDGGVVMSHAEPLEAGMTCLQCHLFTEEALVTAKNGRMQTCVLCHDGKQARADCGYCHQKSPTAVASEKPSPDMATELVTVSPQAYCYNCHNPRPCDSCHGLRIPHSAAFQDTGDEKTMGIHADAARQRGWRMCVKCHNAKSPTGAVLCDSCHGPETYKR
jgi:hypothetical protein